MRAVLVGIDYVKDIDGSFKILEINTNAAIPNFNPLLYLNTQEYQSFLTNNQITEVHFIFTQGNLISGYYRDLENGDLTNPPIYLSVLGMKTTELSGVSFVTHQILNNGSIPNIEDGEGKLIIRQTYDSTALIDYDYARDNFQFLKLLHDNNPNNIPKTCFNHFSLGIDTIDTIRDNGIHPNFIIKKRYPISNGGDYPKLFKISTIEELNQLKSNLMVDDILQEYVYNPNDLLNGRLKTYRSIDLFYGELDVLNLFTPFEQTNPMVLTSTTDYTDTMEVQSWERPKYIQKTEIRHCDNYLKLYKCDDTNVVLKNDGTIVDPSQLIEGDILMSLNIPDLPLEEKNYMSWSGDTNTILTGTTSTGATIVNINVQEIHVWIKTITLSDGSVFSDTMSAAAMVNYSGVSKFVKFFYLNVGDEIFVYDHEYDLMKKLTITNVGISYSRENAYLIDVEDTDIYMVAEETTLNPKIFLIEHNGPCTSYWWYGDKNNCEVIGGSWDDYNYPPEDYNFSQYHWFCGEGCSQEAQLWGFLNSCECKDAYMANYGMGFSDAAWACRYFCCSVPPEGCGVTLSETCDSYQEITPPPCGCIPDVEYNCDLPKGGWPDAPSMPPGN